ncbi:MAG: hypothetical protein RBG13Loki_2268 [Promethearchaeota archaeon CR_4]|nr:MAG: hypothetical protein RBG13Loki_2268 [Candidatus Lokiarchaeota archaeon CR_4]
MRGRFRGRSGSQSWLAPACRSLPSLSFSFNAALFFLELSYSTFSTVEAIVMLCKEHAWATFRASLQFTNNFPTFRAENFINLVFSRSFCHIYHY